MQDDRGRLINIQKLKKETEFPAQFNDDSIKVRFRALSQENGYR